MDGKVILLKILIKFFSVILIPLLFTSCKTSSNSSGARIFFYYIGKSQTELIKSFGEPEIIKQNGDGYIIQYSGEDTGERITYATKNDRVVTAIQSYPGLSLSEAKEKKDVMILYYMSHGFTKEGSQAGLTILKNRDNILSIGYLDDTGGRYVTIITAYN